MIQRKSIPMFVILHFVTCGLFGLYWMACLTDDINTAAGTEEVSGVLAVILTFCTFGIFGLYWAFKAGEKLDMVNPKPGRTEGNNGGILYLLLYIFGGGVIVYALIQNELNNMADN